MSITTKKKKKGKSKHLYFQKFWELILPSHPNVNNIFIRCLFFSPFALRSISEVHLHRIIRWTGVGL